MFILASSPAPKVDGLNKTNDEPISTLQELENLLYDCPDSPLHALYLSPPESITYTS